MYQRWPLRISLVLNKLLSSFHVQPRHNSILGVLVILILVYFTRGVVSQTALAIPKSELALARAPRSTI